MKIDLNECKPGDELRLRNGEIATYRGPSCSRTFPHLIDLPICGFGSRTNSGHIFSRCDPNDRDVIEIISKMKKYETKNGKGCVGEKRVDLLKIKVDCLEFGSLKAAIQYRLVDLGARKEFWPCPGECAESDPIVFVDAELAICMHHRRRKAAEPRHEISLDDFFRLTKDDVCFGMEPPKPKVQRIDIEDIKKRYGVVGEFEITGMNKEGEV